MKYNDRGSSEEIDKEKFLHMGPEELSNTPECKAFIEKMNELSKQVTMLRISKATAEGIRLVLKSVKGINRELFKMLSLLLDEKMRTLQSGVMTALSKGQPGSEMTAMLPLDPIELAVVHSALQILLVMEGDSYDCSEVESAGSNQN